MIVGDNSNSSGVSDEFYSFIEVGRVEVGDVDVFYISPFAQEERVGVVRWVATHHNVVFFFYFEVVFSGFFHLFSEFFYAREIVWF